MSEQPEAKCRLCGKSRGPTADPTQAKLCRSCCGTGNKKLDANRAKLKALMWNGKSETVADKVERRPGTSWWMVPRDQWAEAIQKERDRMQAGGASAENV